MRSKQSIIEQHIEFCKQHNIAITQDQLKKWSQIPAKFLQRILANERLQLAQQ